MQLSESQVSFEANNGKIIEVASVLNADGMATLYTFAARYKDDKWKQFDIRDLFPVGDLMMMQAVVVDSGIPYVEYIAQSFFPYIADDKWIHLLVR